MSDFTRLSSCANRVMEECLPNSTSCSFIRLRSDTSEKLTRYAKQVDPVATAIICAIQHDPKQLDAYKNGYGEPKDHEEAMFTYEQRLKDRVRFNETNILYRGYRWMYVCMKHY